MLCCTAVRPSTDTLESPPGSADDAGIDLAPQDPVARDFTRAAITLATSCSCSGIVVSSAFAALLGFVLFLAIIFAGLSLTSMAAALATLVLLGGGGCCTMAGAGVGWLVLGSALHAVGLWDWSLAQEVFQWTGNVVAALFTVF